jgi:hypothetical protein
LKLVFVSAIAFAPFLTSCSGGAGTAPFVSSQTPSQSSTLTSATSAVESTAQRYAASVPVSNDLLYVSNQGTNSITVYHHDVSENSAPIAVIAGPMTGLNAPGQLSEDAQGNLYVANGVNTSFVPPIPTASILVFAHGANGNVAPIRTISGPATLLHYAIGGLTVDQTTGKIFVVDTDVPFVGNGGALLRFPPNASGNTSPFAYGRISNWGNQLASDSTGLNIIEAEIVNCCAYVTGGVAMMNKQFYNNTAPSYTSRITALPTNGVADDPTTKTYLVTTGNGVMRFVESTNGNGQYTTPLGGGYQVHPASFSPPIVSTLTSETCGGNLVLGYLRNIYVVHSKATGGCPTDAVYVYTHDSSGNAPPLRALSGAATQLSSPFGIYEGK